MEQNNKQTMPCFELGNLYVFKEEDEDGELTIIGKLIGKNESEDTLTFGNQYEIENEKFVTDQAFDLRISVHEELREATEGEAATFQKAFTLWKKSKNQPSFRTFDKVLVRDSDEHKWRPAIFARTRIGESPYKYNALLLCTGHVGDFIQCIPYKGRYYQKKRAAEKKEKKIILNPDIDKAKALFRDPTKVAHLQWLLEHRNA